MGIRKTKKIITLPKPETLEVPQPPTEDTFDGDIKKDTDENGDTTIVFSKKSEDFKYETKVSQFQQNLKEFYTEPEPEPEPEKVLKIEAIITNTNSGEKDTADTINEFNNQVKELMNNRNKNATPQSYQSKENVIHVEQDNDKKINILRNTVVQNKNTNVVRGKKGNNPVSRVNNRVSGNRML